MQLRLANGTPLCLSKQDFFTQGGEGCIYVHNGSAYKLYTDIQRAICAQKFYELQQLSSPYIVKPTQLLYDMKGAIVGYQMPFIQDAKPLCSVFNSAYRKKHSLHVSVLLSLITQLQEIIQQVHQSDCLIVDLGEHNLLISADHQKLYIVDVDSFQTPSFPATALLDSVRDWHAPKGIFSAHSDWFSFAILCVQILVGIHPYRGKHPKIHTLKERMLKSISIFDPEVLLPPVCPALKSIPQPLQTWLKNVLQNGERSLPPEKTTQAIPSFTPKVPPTRLLIKKPLIAVSHSIRAHHFDRNQHNLLTDQHVHRSQQRIPLQSSEPHTLISEPQSGRLIVVYLHKKHLSLYDLQRQRPIGPPLPVDNISCFSNQIFALQSNRLLKIQIHLVGQKLLYTTSVHAMVLPRTSMLFEGCLIQNMLGTKICTPLDIGTTRNPISLPLPTDSRIIDATCSQHVLQVLYRHHGSIHLRRIFFDTNISQYTYHDVGMENTHFIITDSGVGLWLRSCGDLELFSTADPSAPRKELNSVLCGHEQLRYSNGQVLYIYENQLIAMAMSG